MPSTRVGSGSVSCSSDEGAVRGRPGHAVVRGDVGYRAGRIPDRLAHPRDLGITDRHGISCVRLVLQNPMF